MRTIKLFVVGPFSDPDRVMTIHWFLFYLKGPKIIDKEAKLIVIRPLKIGRTDVRDKFQDFQPLWLVHLFVVIALHGHSSKTPPVLYV